MTLPELHGWAPAAVVARRLKVTPSTVRRRALRGLLDTIPNPLGPGALYREQCVGQPHPRGMGGKSGETPKELHHGAVNRLLRDDRYVLGLLPAKPPEIASTAGLTSSAAHRRLRRLEVTGFARPGDVVPAGPRGGRPSRVWRAV